MSTAFQIAVEITRYFAFVAGVAGAMAAITIGQRYARSAMRVGVRQMWRDLKSLHLETLLPIHVAIVSFVMAGLLLGTCFETVARLGSPPTWRLALYLPLNFLAVLSITLVGLFVKNKGQRVAVLHGKHRDRAELDAVEISELEERQGFQDDRGEAMDVRDGHQDDRDDAADRRSAALDEQSIGQDARSKFLSRRGMAQDKRGEALDRQGQEEREGNLRNNPEAKRDDVE